MEVPVANMNDDLKGEAISRRTLLKTTGKAAAGLAVAGTLGNALAMPYVVSAKNAEATTTIDFQSGLTGGDGDAMLALVKQFMKENPDIKVNSQLIDWGTFFTKLFAALAAGNGPDVFIIHLQEMLEFQTKNALLQVDNYFGGSGLQESDYSKQELNYVSYQGHIYGVPLDLHGWGLYANPALIQKAGLSLAGPKTSDEFIHYAQKLTLDNKGHDATMSSFDPSHIVQWGTTTSWDSPPTFLQTLWSFGGDTLSADGKTATLNTPAMTNALNYWHNLIFTNHVCGKPSVVNSITNNLFFGNKLAMRLDGNWIRSFFVQNPKMGHLTWMMPTFGSKEVAWQSGHVLVAPAGLASNKQAAVQRFITWLSRHDVTWSATAGHIPARTSSQHNSMLKNLWPQNYFAKELPTIGRIETPTPNIGQAETAFTNAVDGCWNGTITVAKAQSQAQSGVQQALV
jgi:ABC-type glycerol-3-phosphate transport system substrate-binding protein